MSGPPDDDFRFLDDLYTVRSTGESDDGCLLLLDPKNARRIFYVHINRLLVHIGAFDPVHIGLLLSAKHTTAWTRPWLGFCPLWGWVFALAAGYDPEHGFRQRSL